MMTATPPPILVQVAMPQVQGDQVLFTWQGDETLSDPPDGGLWYRYEGIEMAQFSPELLLEIFLSLRLHTYTCLKRPVDLVLPLPMPKASIDYWRAYHRAGKVRVTPMADTAAYSPWRDPDQTVKWQFDAGVFFGGGRDSLAAACLLGEVYGRERVLLMQCVDPGSPGEAARQGRADRLETLSLGPARDDLGFPTQRVWTNLRALAMAQGGKRFESHVEQYTTAFLPVLLARGVPLSTFGYPWIDYLILNRPDGPKFLHPRSRPEALVLQSRHYAYVFGVPHQLVNINAALTGFSCFQIIHQRYPEATPLIMSCPNGDASQRWCRRCRRCARHAWHCLSEGVITPGFDLNWVMSRSPWMQKVMQGIAGLQIAEQGDRASALDTNELTTLLDFPVMCNALYRSDPAFAQANLGNQAWGNYTVLRALYGHQPLLHYGEAPAQAFVFLPGDLATRLRQIIGQYLMITSKITEPVLTAEGTARGPWALPVDLDFLRLPHLQPGEDSAPAADRLSGPGSS